MKDSRVTLWTNPTTHSTGTTTNTGDTVDLFASGVPAGGTYYGSNEDYGLGVQIIQTVASGTAQVTVWTWEHSADDSNWYVGGTIGVGTMTASAVARLRGTIRTKDRYIRLKASNTGTGTSTSNAYAEDFGGLMSAGGEAV